MPVHLPDDLLTRVKPLLLPYLRDKAEREALLIETFFLRDPRVLEQINLEGSPDGFATRCIGVLVERIGCLAEQDETGERQHSLSALLSVIRSRCGVEKHAEIDRLCDSLNRCDQIAPPDLPPAPPVWGVAQTIAIPPDERKPGVFICTTQANADFAARLIDSLSAAGHRCWVDASGIEGGADWQRAFCDGMNLSYALVVVCTHEALESEFVQDAIQWAHIRHKRIIPLLLEDVTVHDRFFGVRRLQSVRFDLKPYQAALTDLLTALPAAPQSKTKTPRRSLTRREHELAYLDRLRFDDFRLEKFERAEYVMSGGSTRRTKRDEWQALAMQPEYAVMQDVQQPEAGESALEVFTDVVQRISELRRVVILGEPGAGKTHTLRVLAKPLYTAALSDATASIPLLINLGNWDRPDMPFDTFVRAALGELGVHLDGLFASHRAVLLLDGLNEFPADQRAHKYPQVEAFITAHPAERIVITCRQADYPVNLHLSRVLIRPLDPLRIRDFARRALHGAAKGDAFFWELVTVRAQHFESRFKALFAAQWADWEATFWLADALPAEVEWGWDYINGVIVYGGWNAWKALRDNPSSLFALARNPYMLRMLLNVYRHYGGALPDNRGKLFEQFVNGLLVREKLATIDERTQTVTLTGEGSALLAGLQQMAFEMQVRRSGKRDSSAGASLDRTVARAILNDRLLYLAVSIRILNSGDVVRFSHQMLQAYFVARYMDGEIRAGRLKDSPIWKADRWWEHANWEDAPVLDWANTANPEGVTQDAATPEAAQSVLHEQWLKRLTKGVPTARAAVGRARGLTGWDNRPGVRLRLDGLPDIAWSDAIPAGMFIMGSDRDSDNPRRTARIEQPYRIAKYPITYRQFQAFVEAPDGWNNLRWWEGLALPDGHTAESGDQVFKVWNHPRERVSWFDAIAFCRWLSYRMGGGFALDSVNQWAVRLPTEQEWERAARGTDGREYPYGNTFDAARGNTGETGIGQTSAVGLFPEGVSPVGALDMSGNVFEWCLTDYQNPAPSAEDEVLSSDKARVLRGGSWHNLQYFARTTYRYFNAPHAREGDFVGFRLVAGCGY